MKYFIYFLRIKKQFILKQTLTTWNYESKMEYYLTIDVIFLALSVKLHVLRQFVAIAIIGYEWRSAVAP